MEILTKKKAVMVALYSFDKVLYGLIFIFGCKAGYASDAVAASLIYSETSFEVSESAKSDFSSSALRSSIQFSPDAMVISAR